MKKVQEKRRVIRTMSESQIKELGTNLWFRSKFKGIAVLLFICLAWAFATTEIMGSDIIYAIIAIIPSVFVLLWWCIKMTKVGNKFWDNIKDKEEPIDLG